MLNARLIETTTPLASAIKMPSRACSNTAVARRILSSPSLRSVISRASRSRWSTGASGARRTGRMERSRWRLAPDADITSSSVCCGVPSAARATVSRSWVTQASPDIQAGRDHSRGCAVCPGSGEPIHSEAARLSLSTVPSEDNNPIIWALFSVMARLRRSSEDSRRVRNQTAPTSASRPLDNTPSHQDGSSGAGGTVVLVGPRFPALAPPTQAQPSASALTPGQTQRVAAGSGARAGAAGRSAEFKVEAHKAMAAMSTLSPRSGEPGGRMRHRKEAHFVAANHFGPGLMARR